MNPRNKVLLYFLIFPLFFTSCNLSEVPLAGKFFRSSTKTPTASKQVTITYWGLFEPKSVLDPLISEYERTHPNVKIDYEQKNFSDLGTYKETVLTRLKNKTAPDIIRVHSTWVPYFYQYLSAAPSDVIDKEEFSKLFYPVSVDTCVINNNVYALPLMYDGLVLLYNKEMLSEANVERLPKTWDEFRELAKKLTIRDKKGNLLRAGAAIGGSRNVAHSSDILGLMMAQSKVKIPDDLESELASSAILFYTSFEKEDKVWASYMPYSPVAFSQQRVAMIFAPSWQIFGILQGNPTLSIGVAPVPQIPVLGGEELTNDNWANFWVEAVSNASPNKRAAWDFIKFLAQRENQQKLYSEESKIRPFGEPYSLISLKGNLSSDKYLSNLILGAPTAKTGIIVDRAGNDPYVEAINTAIDAVLKGIPPKEALSTAKKTIQMLDSQTSK